MKLKKDRIEDPLQLSPELAEWLAMAWQCGHYVFLARTLSQDPTGEDVLAYHLEFKGNGHLSGMTTFHCEDANRMADMIRSRWPLEILEGPGNDKPH